MTVSPIKVSTNIFIIYSEDISWPRRTNNQANTDDASFLLIILVIFFFFVAFQHGYQWTQRPVYSINIGLSRQGNWWFLTKHNKMLNIFFRIISYEKTYCFLLRYSLGWEVKTSSSRLEKDNSMKASDQFFLLNISTVPSNQISVVGGQRFLAVYLCSFSIG